MAIHADDTSSISFQFHILLLRVSPAIWRRILLPSNATLADLHFVLQFSMGWNDSFSSEFVLHGRYFAVARPGDYRDPSYPERMTLAACRLRLGQRFSYTYNFLAKWQLQIRLEKLLPPEQSISYPYCLAGARSGPPDWCAGPTEFITLRDHHTLSYIAYRSTQLAADFQAQAIPARSYHIQQQQLDYWRHVDHFDRKALNCCLRQYAEDAPQIQTSGDIPLCN